MVRKVVQKTSFLGGEAGDLLKGRSDLAQHQLGASRLLNWIALKSGPATRRPGTRFVRGTTDNKPARLIEFVFSLDSTADIFVLEITKSDANILVFKMIRASDGQTFDVPSANSVDIPASDIDLNEIQYAQSADVLFLVHRNMQPVKVTRASLTPTFSHSHINYPFVTKPFQLYPMRDPNTSATTMTLSATSVGAATMTCSASFFTADHVGSFFRIQHGSTHGWVRVDSFTSATVVGVTIITAAGATSATDNWQESAWSDHRGWPGTITIYNQRMVYGGNRSQPDTFWMSAASNYAVMTSTDETTHEITSGLSDALRFTLASNKVNSIQWMVGGKKLSIGTTSSEWVGTVSNDGVNLLVQFDEETTHGSGGYIQPTKYAYTIPFVQRSGKTIREMAFDFDSDNYQATDLNIFASHIGTAYGEFADSGNLVSQNIRIVQMAFQESPFNILWVIDSVGRLYGLTRDRQQQIAAWHSHQIGGFISSLIRTGSAGDDYPSSVGSITCVPSLTGGSDRLWMVVAREIDGELQYHIEYLDEVKSNPRLRVGFATGEILVHLDCAKMESSSPETTSFPNGFEHLAGSTAYAVASNDAGAIVFCGEVAINNGGGFTLPTPFSRVAVGLNAPSILRLLPVEGGNAPELPMNSTKRVDSVAIRLHQSFGLRIGKNLVPTVNGDEENDEFEAIPFNQTGFPEIPTFTGTKEVPVPTDGDTDGSFALAMEEPWPCTIVSLSMRTVSNEV